MDRQTLTGCRVYDPLKLFRQWKSRNRQALADQPAAHMTWAQTSLGRSVSRTGLFLKKQIWIWPILATVVMGVIGFGIRSAIESTMKGNLRSGLETLVGVEAAMLENWLKVQTSNAAHLANDLQVRDSVHAILALHEEESDEGSLEPDSLPAAEKKAPTVRPVELHKQLQKRLAPAMSTYGYAGYFVADKSRRIVSSSSAELIGRKELPEYEDLISRTLEGGATACAPFASLISMKDEFGRVRSGVPTMFVSAPIRDASFEVVAVLALRIRPEQEFTRILQLGRIGESGETFAFNQSGLLVSNSRFDDELVLLGLLADQEHAQSIVSVQLRDPQGDMTAGFRPKVRRSEMPLTKMAADAVAGNSGSDVEGYRDCRGVQVVGAWVWLSQYKIGVATEISQAQAFRPLFILQWTFWTLFGLLCLSSAAIFAFTLVVARLRRSARAAEIEARQLGQYTLEQKLGAGAMGVVYKGFHAMLRRPTAIKMLDLDKVNDASIQRFEREVQITCQLNHPSTVAIYDYGRTPEGLFYYAMEYLDGVNLQALVEQYGPLPEGRVIRILSQVCGSLFEAHSLGLVHRDVKPANIMLNRRGGESDVVKVLDFGLVKALDEQKLASLSAANSLAGTPLYMAPEAIQAPNSVDARSDLYAVGAVGYFLLTGKPVFEAVGIVELCHQHIDAVPVPPSQRLGKAVSSELEDALLACLEKSRTKRPHSARDLAQMLARCPAAGKWSMEEADAWWGRHDRKEAASHSASADTAKSSAVFNQTIISDHGEPE